jgi:hypothetical protein
MTLAGDNGFPVIFAANLPIERVAGLGEDSHTPQLPGEQGGTASWTQIGEHAAE